MGNTEALLSRRSEKAPRLLSPKPSKKNYKEISSKNSIEENNDRLNNLAVQQFLKKLTSNPSQLQSMLHIDLPSTSSQPSSSGLKPPTLPTQAEDALPMSLREKMEKNKGKLSLQKKFSNLEYGVRYFDEPPQRQESLAAASPDSSPSSYISHRYEGTFRKGQIFGQGIYFYPTGSVYAGGICERGREGTGIFYFANGNVYSGMWLNNEQNGLGKFFFVQQQPRRVIQFYTGYFKDSLFYGFGCYCYQTKYYIGFWKDDHYEGYGRICLFNGEVQQEGIFQEDRLLKQIKEVKKHFPNNWQVFLPSFAKENIHLDEILLKKPLI